MAKLETGSQSTELELQHERSEVINALRFPMALGVVFLHGKFLTEEICTKAKDGIWNILRTYSDGITVLFSIAVPLFVYHQQLPFLQKLQRMLVME